MDRSITPELMTGVSNRREYIAGHQEDSGTHATRMLLAHGLLLTISVYAGVHSWNLGFIRYIKASPLRSAPYTIRIIQPHTYPSFPLQKRVDERRAFDFPELCKILNRYLQHHEAERESYSLLTFPKAGWPREQLLFRY